MTLSIMTLSLMGLFATFSMNDTQGNCHNTECHAECRILFIVMLIIIMLSVVMLNVIMLTVLAPYFEAEIGKETCVWLV
jgi:hypothetical protein